jgi:hypothetical protein
VLGSAEIGVIIAKRKQLKTCLPQTLANNLFLEEKIVYFTVTVTQII